MKNLVVLRLTCIEEVGIGKAFSTQLERMGSLVEWITFRNEFCLPGVVLDENSKQGLGRLFCHLRGLPVIIDDTVWLPQIPMQAGYVARFIVVQSLLNELELSDAWDSYFLEEIFGLLDKAGNSEASNWSVSWENVTCFFERQNLICMPLCSNGQTASKLLDNVRANVSLSGLDVSDEMSQLASLAANGIITTDEALRRLGIII